jgi:gliding motility-associated lipoprotein GldH
MVYCLWTFSSCHPDRIYDKHIDIEKYTWDINNKLSYDVDITDTTQIYRISVNVRHTNFFQFNNMWIMVYTTFPDGKTISQRVELPLADKNGKWYGDCLGDICDLNVSIQEKAYFNQTGKHTFMFEQIMRNKELNIERLPGIMAMGLRIDKVAARNNTAQ